MAGGTVNNPGYPAFGFEGQIASNNGRGTGMYLAADSTLALSTTATERMRITSSGNVGIGTSSPAVKLDVAGSVAINNSNYGFLRLGDANNNGWAISKESTDNSFNLWEGGEQGSPVANRFKITQGGNVGIGTSSPTSKLHITSSGSSWESGLMLENTTAEQKFVLSTRNDLGSPSRFSISNETVFQEYLSLLASNGYVGIGVINPQYQLQLNTDSAAKPSTSTWTISSDERLKENIEAADLDICYNAVKNIPLKRYKWKDEIYSAEQVADRSKIGWIAQDVQAVFPKAVNEHKFVYNQVKDEDGNVVSEDVIEDCLSLNTDQLYATMYGAIQKLMNTVETLQARIDQLESSS
jgi:hypothetical protein